MEDEYLTVWIIKCDFTKLSVNVSFILPQSFEVKMLELMLNQILRTHVGWGAPALSFDMKHWLCSEQQSTVLFLFVKL